MADTTIKKILIAGKLGGQAGDRYLQKVDIIINTIEEQFVMAKNSRYKETEWNVDEIADGILSLMTKSMFYDTFSEV